MRHHEPGVHESPYESIILNVYWLFVEAGTQYSSVLSSSAPNGALSFKTVVPDRIL